MNISKLRKYLSDHVITQLTIDMPVILRCGGTVLYNSKSGTNFHVTITSGITVSATGDSLSAGNISIDGVNGAGSSTGGGSLTVHGILSISGILYLSTNNTTNPVSVNIANGGMIQTAYLSCANSGSAGHTLSIADGGSLDLTKGDWGIIGSENNTYQLSAGSTVMYSGDSLQTIGSPANYHHLTCSGIGIKLMDTLFVINGNLTIGSGAVLHVNAGKSLTVHGACWFEGSECLVLQSPLNPGPSGSFIHYGNLSGTGTIRIDRFLSRYDSVADTKYHLLSSPVAYQPIQPGFVHDPPFPAEDFYRWDESSATWVNCKNEAGLWNYGFQPGDDRTMNPGAGYLVAYPENEIHSFTGNLNTGEIIPVITFSSATGYIGFNLIGNPFSSALSGEIDTWIKSNVDNAIWIWDGSAGNYLTWNGMSGTIPEGIIPAMQGFFIRTNGPDPLLTIPTSSRIHHGQNFIKSFSGLKDHPLTLTVMGNGYRDALLLCCSDQQDPFSYDVRKLFGHSMAPQLFLNIQDTFLSIRNLSDKESHRLIPVGFRAGKPGFYTLHASGLESFLPDCRIILEDRQENLFRNIRLIPEYTFFAQTGMDPERFILHLDNPQITQEKENSDQIRMFLNSKILHISHLPETNSGFSLQIFDMLGRLVFTDSFKEEAVSYNLPMQTGHYVVVIIGKAFVWSKSISLY